MFRRIRKWFKVRKAKKLTDDFFAVVEKYGGIGHGRQPIIREFEGGEAYVMNMLLNGCPHLVIASNGREVITAVHNLSREAFRQGLFDMAKDETFREALTDIVIDINTEKK